MFAGEDTDLKKPSPISSGHFKSLNESNLQKRKRS